VSKEAVAMCYSYRDRRIEEEARRKQGRKKNASAVSSERITSGVRKRRIASW